MPLAVLPRQIIVDPNGAPRVGALLYTYDAGTTNPHVAYTTKALNIPHPNPIVSTSDGFFPAIYVNKDDGDYKIVITDYLGATIWTEDNIPAGNEFTSEEIALGLDSLKRTVAEIAAEVTPSNYSYVAADSLGNMARYGATGDWNGTTGTDDTIALRKAGLVIQQRGGGVLDLGSGRYRIYSDTGDTNPILNLSNCRGVHIKSNGAEILIDRTFSGSTIFDVFRFSACNGISIDPIRVICTSSQPATQRADRGVEVFKFLQGCENIEAGPCYFRDVRAAFMFRRESSDSTSYKSRRIRLAKIRAYRVGYPLSCILSGDNLDAEVDSEECTRSYYPYGVVDHDVRVRSRNHEGNADCLLSTAVGNGIDSLKLHYTNIDSTVADSSINCVKLEYGDQSPAVCSDIRIHLNIRTTGSAFLGYGFIGTKLTDAGAADATDRGHTLDGFTLSGRITGAHASQRTIAFCGVGTWGAGENVRNVRFSDLRLDAAGQALINLASLEDIAIFDNFYAATTVDITGNSSSRIVMLGGDVPGFVSTTNIDRIATRVNGVLANSNGLSASKTHDPGSLADGAGETTTVTCTGAVAGDFAIASFSLDLQGITLTAWVSTANTVSVRFQNESGGVLDLSSGTLRVRVYQQ